MKIEFTEEKRGEIRRIQDSFRNQLSPAEILKATAIGINSAMSRSVARIRKEIRAEYNISPKYLNRAAKVTQYAKASANQLYAHISLKGSPFPVIAFKPMQSGSDIVASYHRTGDTTIIEDAFIATVPAGKTSTHTGVFFRGKYKKRRGLDRSRRLTKNNKVRITELYGPSVYGMGTYKKVSKPVQDAMGKEALARVEGILRSRVEKIAR